MQMDQVMLALSTFRHSEKAINFTIQEAKKGRRLARYFIGSDIGFYEELKSKYEKEILEEHRETAKTRVGAIEKLAGEYSIKVEKHIRTGRFALQVLPFEKKTDRS